MNPERFSVNWHRKVWRPGFLAMLGKQMFAQRGIDQLAQCRADVTCFTLGAAK